MGFWGKLGKGLLKIAPIAAMAIPGIGPIASMAIQGGLGAANAKASGGGWKDALLGAGIGAGTSLAGGLGGVSGKGLAPSKGIMGTLGNIAKTTGKGLLQQAPSMLSQMGQQDSTSQLPTGINGPLGQEGSQIQNPMMGQQPQMQQQSPQLRRKPMGGLGPTSAGLASAFSRGSSQARAY